MGKVTISGDVELETLIRTPNKNGKYAELIGDPKQNSGMQVEAKLPKRRRGGGKPCKLVAQFVKQLCKLVAQSMKQLCKLVAWLCMLGVSKMLAMKL
nr:heavy metal-associated isoprenylated plant protein 32-like [Ipomoea batatas]